MTSARYVLRIPDLESGPKILRVPIPPEWIDEILEDTEVRHAAGPGELSVSATKNGADVLVRGHIAVTVQVPCSRTLEPAIYTLKPELFLLLTPRRSHEKGRVHSKRSLRAKAHADKAHPGLAQAGPAELGKAKGGPEKAKGGTEKAKGKGPKGHSAWDADPELSDEDAATDTYSGDEIVLDPFLREFILLEVPMVPLREDLRDSNFEARPPLPENLERTGDPRLSPLGLLKELLQKKD
jgi:uncharacterized protein